MALPVKAELTVMGSAGAVEPALDVCVTVRTSDVRPDDRRVFVALTLENGTVWRLALEPATAAYLAGLLAHASGVVTE